MTYDVSRLISPDYSGREKTRKRSKQDKRHTGMVFNITLSPLIKTER